MKKIAFAAVALLFLLAVHAHAQDIPEPKGFVNDFANIIADDIKVRIDSSLRSYERATTIEMAIVSVPSLEGRTVEDYTIALANKWGVGKKSNNGLVILVAPEERKWRIEVGYGLEPYLTDAAAKRIGEGSFKELFRQKKYGEGIEKAVQRIQEELGSVSWQIREEERVRKQEEDNRIAARNMEVLLSVFFFLLALAALGSLTWFIVKYFMNKAERKRRMATAIEELETKIEKHILRCEALEGLDPKLAKSAMGKLKNFRDATPALKRYCAAKKHEDGMRRLSEQEEGVRDAVKVLFEKERCREYVVKSAGRFFKMKKEAWRQIKSATDSFSTLMKEAPKTVWGKYGTFTAEVHEAFEKGRKEINKASDLAEKKDYLAAEKAAVSAMQRAESALSLLNALCKEYEEWKEAKKEGEKRFMDASDEKKKEMKEKCEENGVMNWILIVALITSEESNGYKSSYSSPSYSSSSDSSSGSFGGGSFGGGGASGGW